MTDCTKIRAKLTYSQELGCIVGSTLSFDDTRIITYDDIHLKIKEIQNNNAVASQVRCVVLKVINHLIIIIIKLLINLKLTRNFLDSYWQNSSNCYCFVTNKR